MEYDVPLLKDTTANIKLIGLEELMIPFLQFTSSQRVSMFASHIVQALPPEHAEHPYIFTGYENIIGKYSFNYTERDQDIYILDVIPKYPENRGARPLKLNPRYTVIYIGRSDGMVRYFHLDKYTKGTDGYGYKNTWMNTSMLKPDVIVPKEVKFSKSPSHIGNNGYAMGCNANVAFVSFPEVNNDAFLISDRIAKKFETTSICTMDFDIKPNQVPLNLYGDNEEHKFIPDIGEFVRDDGIVCGFRTPTDSTFVSDMMSLNTPYVLHDDLYFAPPGSQIIDVDFYTSPLRNKVKTDRMLYAQVDKYLQPMSQYWQRVIACYQKVKENKKIAISPEFNTFVTRAFAFEMAAGKRVPGIARKPDIKLCRGKERIEFIHVTLTYQHTRPVSNAFKLSDRYGAKGVVSYIKPLNEMPVDDYGFHCDVCIDPHAIPNRMNPGQMYEAGINRVSVFVQRQALQLRQTQGDQAAIDHILGYIRRIHPAYADTVKARVDLNPTYFLDTIAKAEDRGDVGIFLMIPPFLKHITPEKMLELEEVYQVKSSPVTFYPLDKDGNPYKSRTKCNVSIGSKYMYILYKVPHAKAPGVGYINQFKVPVKPSQHARMMYPIGQTPLRIGEDETRIINMCSGPIATTRLMGLYANSFEAVKVVCDTLLRSKDPSNIARIPISNKEIMETNNIVGVAKHLAATMGINMGNIDCEAFDEVKFTADLNTRHPGDF